MAVTDTSRRAYYIAVLTSAESQKDRIMAFMVAAKRPVTRRDISQYIGIPMHIVSARVKGLIGKDKENPDYIWVHHIGRCKYNTKKIEVEYLVPMIEKFKQRRQFDWSQATLGLAN